MNFINFLIIMNIPKNTMHSTSVIAQNEKYLDIFCDFTKFRFYNSYFLNSGSFV